MSDFEDLPDSVEQFRDRLTEVARRILRDAQQPLASRAQANMRVGGTDVSPFNDQEGEGTLRRVSGRLSRSLQGARSAQPSAGSIRSAPESINDITVTPNGALLQFGSKVPYAAIHEYGGSIDVTEDMRDFFWAKHAATGATRWKRLAIGAEQNEAFHIPARPYLEPALSEALPEMKDIALDTFIEAFREAL